LKIWQVKTICPVNWSDEDGGWIELCPDDVDKVEGTSVEKLKSGVASSSVGAGDESKGGVEACNVANRSGVGVEAELRKLHPRIKIRVIIVQYSLALFVVQLD
jgi:hypothetical protein